MKYYKITDTYNPKILYYAYGDSPEQLKHDYSTFNGLGRVFTEITKEEYEHHKWVEEIQARADKGQEVQNAIELNAAFREYVRSLMDNTKFLIDGNQTDMILRPTESIHRENEEKHTKEWKAYKSLLENIITFERRISIATNVDPKHPVSLPNRQSMENLIAHIKANEPELWTDIAKMLKVEEAYEPKAAVDAWIAVEQAANPHINMQPTTDTDTQIVDSVVSGGTK